MVDWPEGPVPCAENPERWTVPSVVHAGTEDAWANHLALAVVECRACPALAACGEWARQSRPHRKVQAGLIYDTRDKPYEVYEWRAAARNRVKSRARVEKMRGQA